MSNPFSDSDSLNDSDLLYPGITNYCCCSCSRALVHTANLATSTAFSNRFLYELTEKDPAMEQVSRLLGKLSVSLHYLASKLIRHIISHGFGFDHYDPGKPAWSGEPTDVVLDGNRDMVEDVRVLLEKLKSHKHTMERNLIKKYLKRTNLPLHWDELENIMVGVSEPEKRAALGINLEDSINAIDEVKFDPKITSTDKKTEDVNDNKEKDEEILKSYLNITGEDGNSNKPPIEIFKSENPPNYMKSENEVGPEYSKEVLAVNNEEDVKIGQSKMKDSGYGSNFGENIKDDEKHSSYGSSTNSDDVIEDGEEITKAATEDNVTKDEELSGHEIFKSEDTFAAGKSAVIKKENAEDAEQSRYTLTWRKGKDRAKVVFLVSECSSWSSCGLSVTSLFLGLVNWLEKQGMMVLVPKQYLQSKELSGHKEFKKMSAWAGEADQLVSEVDLVVCLGGDGSLLRVSHMFQDSMPPVLGFGIGERNALYTQTWEEEISKRMILRYLLEEQGMSVMLRARLLVTIMNAGEEKVTTTALNEVTILRGLCPCLAKVKVMVDKTMLYQVEGDGVMVSTPTGSSAYSLSAGGPLVSPTIPCILLTPVSCLSIHPSVIPASSTVVLTPSPSSRADSLPVDVDGRNIGQLKKNGQVVVTISCNSFPQVIDMDRSIYWGEMIRKI